MLQSGLAYVKCRGGGLPDVGDAMRSKGFCQRWLAGAKGSGLYFVSS